MGSTQRRGTCPETETKICHSAGRQRNHSESESHRNQSERQNIQGAEEKIAEERC